MDELLAAIEQLTQKVDMLQASLAATQFKLAYTTKELAEALGTYPQRIHVLRKHGLLTGTRNGQEWIYTREEAERFLERTRGMDLSSEAKIIEAVNQLRISETLTAQKKPAGGNRKARTKLN